MAYYHAKLFNTFNMWKDLFYFSKSDRRALAFFVSVILCTTVFRVCRMSGQPGRENDSPLTVTDTLRKLVSMAVDVVSDSADISAPDETDMVSPAEENAAPSVYGRHYHNGYGRESSVRRQFKYPAGTRIDINSADTVELKKIPGIGSYFAMAIVRYRERLGGYVSTEQLFEVDERLPDDIDSWFFVTDTFRVHRLPVNASTLSELRSHPYMNFYKAREIVEYRRRNGDIRNPQQMSLFEEFSAEDMARLEPYLDFSVSEK